MLLDYDMPLYRPPSEGRSVIIQATLGCSHNRCSFCAMYRTKRFAIRPFDEVARDIDAAAAAVPDAAKVFLADGDALVIPTERLLPVLERVRARFAGAPRVTSYAMPRNLLKKPVEDLRVALFSHHSGAKAPTVDALEHVVGSALDRALLVRSNAIEERSRTVLEQLCRAGLVTQR